jgi:hypothetical protein
MIFTRKHKRIFKMETKNMVTGLLQGVQPCCLEFRHTVVSVTEATPHVLKVLFSTTAFFYHIVLNKNMVKGGCEKQKHRKPVALLYIITPVNLCR